MVRSFFPHQTATFDACVFIDKNGDRIFPCLRLDAQQSTADRIQFHVEVVGSDVLKGNIHIRVERAGRRDFKNLNTPIKEGAASFLAEDHRSATEDAYLSIGALFRPFDEGAAALGGQTHQDWRRDRQLLQSGARSDVAREAVVSP